MTRVEGAPDPAVVRLPVVVYLRGAGASPRTWQQVTDAVKARGWYPVKHRTDAWHLARGGCETVECDFTTTHGGGLTRDTVLVQAVKARYSTSEADKGDLLFVPVKSRFVGELPRPERFDPERTNRLRQPGAVALDADALMTLIEQTIAGSRTRIASQSPDHPH